MKLVKGLVQTSVGGTGACPLVVELDLVPLVGKAMSRGVFRGGCDLSTSLDSLS